MARMHARRKGRSGSSPQTRKESPKWSPKAKDVEKLILELSADGKSSTSSVILSSYYKSMPNYNFEIYCNDELSLYWTKNY